MGLFWDDSAPPPRKTTSPHKRVMPVPAGLSWQKTTELPNLSDAKAIGLDLETFDPELIDHGPGWARGKGHIVGISVSVPEGRAWYLPMRHELEGHDNLPAENVLRWAKDQFANKKQPKVGANILYDVGWLAHEGVNVAGICYDVQYAEALLHSEDAQVALEALGQKYVGSGKDSAAMYAWSAQSYGGKADDKQRANIYRMPPRLVGSYAESDAVLPLQILRAQWPKLKELGLLPVFDMECRLTPLLVAMRRRGVRIDVDKAQEVRAQLIARQEQEQAQLRDFIGFDVNVHASASVAKAFDKLGLAYPRTEAGSPSFVATWLEQQDTEIAKRIVSIRKYSKIVGTFIDGHLLGSQVNGRVHCSFHPLRGKDNGARSGRFSSSSPNLQNIPSRDEAIAPLLRSIFIPDEGYPKWRRYDYSQIEYRKLMHYAVGRSGENIRAFFNAHPETDYHDFVLDMVAPVAGWNVAEASQRKARRKPLKTINFGLIYGMGKKKLGRNLGLDDAATEKLFEAYHQAIPYAAETMAWAAEEATNTGMIRTILGRISRFDTWEPRYKTKNEEHHPLPYHQAQQLWGNNIVRAGLHKALNRKLQGSAADMMKQAMLQCWDAGIFDSVGVPHLTIHDELDLSDDGQHEEAFAEMQHILENAIPLSVPVRADCEIGTNWGNCK